MLKRVLAAVMALSMVLMLTSCGLPFGKKSDDELISEMNGKTSDVEKILKEAIDTYAVGTTETTYNGKPADEATVEDVFVENEESTDVLEQTIGGETYNMVFTTAGKVTLTGGIYDVEGKKLTPTTTIADLYDWKSDEPETADNGENVSTESGKEPEDSDGTDSNEDIKTMERECNNVDKAVGEAVKSFKNDDSETEYNGKKADEALVEDVLKENNIDVSVLSRKIDGVTYKFVYIADGSVRISGGDYKNDGIELKADTKISELGKDTESEKPGDTASDDDQGTSDEEIAQLEKDRNTVNILIKEAVLNYKTNDTTIKYNGKTVQTCTVEDVLVESNLTKDILSRTIDGSNYSFVYTKNGSVDILGGKYKNIGTVLKADTKISSLVGENSTDTAKPDVDTEEKNTEQDTDGNDGEATMETLEKDRAKTEMLLKGAINMYLTKNSDTTYNGKTADICTVGDVFAENNASSDILNHTIDGTEYTYVYTKKGTVAISGGVYKNEGKTIKKDTTISSLGDYKGSIF